jgi:ABC-type multidrug transport system ATPase subunit
VVEALLRRTNLWEVRKQKLGGYSGGMKQRFGVAVALLGNPKLLIVDEPTAGLDPAERVRFLNLLSEIGENSVVILSTHIVDDVSELCTRMAIIDRGEILLEAEPLRAIETLRGRIWRRTSRMSTSALWRGESDGAASSRNRRWHDEAPRSLPLRARLPDTTSMAVALHGGPHRVRFHEYESGHRPGHASSGLHSQFAIHHCGGLGVQLPNLAADCPGYSG